MAIPADIYPRPNSPVAISRMVLTDENGRFTFDRLPPNLPIGLYHDPQQIRGDHSGPLSARKVAFIAMPGKTHKIKMGGNGRPVTGRIVVEGYEGQIDWEDELQRIYIPDWADVSLPNLGKLVCEYDEAFRSAPDDESRQAVVDRYEPLRKEALRLHREKEFEKPTYFFRISKDGRFHIEDMRPGKYIFRPAVSGPTLNQMHTLHIPESREGNPNAPYDVGDLVFTHEPLPPHLRLW